MILIKEKALVYNGLKDRQIQKLSTELMVLTKTITFSNNVFFCIKKAPIVIKQICVYVYVCVCVCVCVCVLTYVHLAAPAYGYTLT